MTSKARSPLAFPDYARLFLGALFGFILLFAGFNLLIDPYATLSSSGVAGLSERKTRAHEDGRRVLVSHEIARRNEQTVLLGSSRTVDGFPEAIADWPGGAWNAGLRGSNAYELAHLAVLAGERPDLRCLVIGLDMGEFAAAEKFKPAFAVSALPDGDRRLSAARVALSPNTLARSLQTVADNLTGGADDPPFADSYPAGEQRRRFLEAPAPTYRYFETLRVDPDRIALLFDALDALAEDGVQVIGFLHPLHAWGEEPLFAAGRGPDYFALRRQLAERFARLSEETALNPCIEGEGAAVLYDFSGFQPFATTPLPADDQTRTHPIFHEPAHYLPATGLAMLDRMRGVDTSGVFSEAFGLKLTPATAAASEAGVLARREAYLATPEGRRLTEILETARAGEAPSPAPRTPITRRDKRAFEARLEALDGVERDAS